MNAGLQNNRFSLVVGGLVAILVVVVLYPIYSHLLIWKKPTVLPLSSFDLQHTNKDSQLVFQSHLSAEDASLNVMQLIKRTKALEPVLTVPSSGLKKDKFTILMPTYKRTDTLSQVFNHYCGMNDIIDQLVMVWNNLDEIVPSSLRGYKCKFPITFLEQKKNSLNNRFILYPEVKTECQSADCIILCIFLLITCTKNIYTKAISLLVLPGPGTCICVCANIPNPNSIILMIAC